MVVWWWLKAQQGVVITIQLHKTCGLWALSCLVGVFCIGKVLQLSVSTSVGVLLTWEGEVCPAACCRGQLQAFRLKSSL